MQSSMEVRTTTDLFHHRYYRLNKLLMKSIGQWPYQSIRVRSVILTVLILFVISQLVPQITVIVKNHHDWDLLMESGTSLICCGIFITKLLSSVFNSQKMLNLLNYIRMDWDIWAEDSDADILHKYAQYGRNLTIMYTVVGYTTCIIFITPPVIPKIIDILLMNDTEAGQFPVPLDYYHTDMQKNYFYIVLHYYLCASMGYTIAIACGTIFIVYVYHGCALFAILGRKLERIGKNEIFAATGKISCQLEKPVTPFEYIASCIENHNHAIEYAELINATYSWYFFFLVGCNMLLISIIGFEIFTRADNMEQAMKFICCNVVAMVHLYVESYMAQILMDHSVSIPNYIFNGEWYNLPLKAQKLLLFMMMRCNTSCNLTAAKIIIVSIESFGVTLKTSLSYFTLLRSV